MNLNTKILGTIFLAIASITGLVSLGNLNSVQAASVDLSNIGCLAVCNTEICPADFSGTLSGNSANGGYGDGSGSSGDDNGNGGSNTQGGNAQSLTQAQSCSFSFVP